MWSSKESGPRLLLSQCMCVIPDDSLPSAFRLADRGHRARGGQAPSLQGRTLRDAHITFVHSPETGPRATSGCEGVLSTVAVIIGSRGHRPFLSLWQKGWVDIVG